MTAATKTLFLVRHAKSSRDDPRLADRDRPLNKRGKRDAPAMARRVAQRAERPEVIVTSPAVRAMATAKAMADGLDVVAPHLVTLESLYDAAADALLQVIHGLDNRYSRAMIVGHNPGMTDLANLLARATIENIPTCGVVIVRFPTPTWADIRGGTGEMVEFDYPKREPE
jgi:phosphohistidine phosphatase